MVFLLYLCLRVFALLLVGGAWLASAAIMLFLIGLWYALRAIVMVLNMLALLVFAWRERRRTPEPKDREVEIPSA